MFVETARQGSLSAAARVLGLSPAVASAAVKRLEEELGVALFVRSTRSLRLTSQGELFLEHSRPALLLMEEGRRAVRTGDAEIRDTLQIAMPSDLGRNQLLGLLEEFLQLHPAIDVRVQLSDRLVNVYRQPVDVALRYGEPADSSLIALPIVPGNRRILCASPDYIQRFGKPQSPRDLTQHNCLCFLLGDEVHARWRFWKVGQEDSVKVKGNRVADDGEAVRRWALAGKGIAYKSFLDVASDIERGHLMALCAGWQTESAPLNLVCADRRLLSTSVQALKAFLVAHFEDQT